MNTFPDNRSNGGERPASRSAKFRKTDDQIVEGFLDTISDVPFAKMSIAGLCRKAGVSRNTFYEHYPDLYSVVDACVRKMVSMVDFMPSQAGCPSWKGGSGGEPMCLLLRRDRRYAALMFDPSLYDHCAEIVVRTAVPPTVDVLKKSSYAEEGRLNVVCSLSVKSCLAAVRDNLGKSDEEWLKVKDTIDLYNRGGLRMTTF